MIGKIRRGLIYLLNGQLGTAIRFKRRNRRLRVDPDPRPESWTPSTRRINRLLSSCTPVTKYLEIGVLWGNTFENVRADERVGVDPYPSIDVRRLPTNATYHAVTSDEFFESLSPTDSFDVIFLDGLHTAEQTYQDLAHAIRHLKVGGAVIIDDTVPSDVASAIPDEDQSRRMRAELGLSGGQWHGDVFRVVWILNSYHPELRWATITDRGNPQTLVWARDREVVDITSLDAAMEASSQIGYGDCFSGGVPAWMNPGLEDEVIARWSESRVTLL
jgi:hypothetical protein